MSKLNRSGDKYPAKPHKKTDKHCPFQKPAKTPNQLDVCYTLFFVIIHFRSLLSLGLDQELASVTVEFDSSGRVLAIPAD